MDHFIRATVPQTFPSWVSSDPPHPTLEGTDLQRLIASWGEALQLPEDVSTAAFGISKQKSR